MAKIKYTVPTSQGVITRTSHRPYTHVVVGGKLRESVCRRLHEEGTVATRKHLADYRAEVASDYAGSRKFMKGLIGGFGSPKFDPNNAEHAAKLAAYVEEQKVNYAKWIADAEARIANEQQILADWLANRRPAGEIGFAGRRDLAEKLARTKAADYEDVEIIEITPDMMREVKPRAKKEAA